MNPEDDLREALHSHAGEIQPAADALSRIAARVARHAAGPRRQGGPSRVRCPVAPYRRPGPDPPCDGGRARRLQPHRARRPYALEPCQPHPVPHLPGAGHRHLHCHRGLRGQARRLEGTRSPERLLPGPAGCLRGGRSPRTAVVPRVRPRRQCPDRCPDPGGQADQTDGGPVQPVGPSSPVVGRWASASLSPDGSRVLGQWSGECEVPNAFVASTAGGKPIPVASSQGQDAPESWALGWSEKGEAIAYLPYGFRGFADERPGVYLVPPEEPARPIYVISPTVQGTPAVAHWRAVP